MEPVPDAVSEYDRSVGDDVTVGIAQQHSVQWKREECDIVR
jgi:hypothetical protein